MTEEEQPTITQADIELWRAGNAAALDAAGYVMDAEQCRQGQFDDLEPAKEFQREIARQRRATLTAIEEMMDEFVTNWPKPKKMKTALALIAKVIRAAINPASHNYWGAGEAECPSDIKAGNGELHTLRCKVCGRDNPEDNRCFEGSTTSLAAQDGLVEALRLFVGCAYPVAEEINQRGHNWCEAYLDDALPIARAALASLGDKPPAQDGLEAEIERLEGLVQTYRGAQLRAEEKLCRERANAQGWKVRAEMLASKLDALASLGDKP